MKKENKEMPALEQTANAKETPRHPAEIEANRLRIELNNERIKTDALSRRCIRLGEALDAALLAEDKRFEKEMFAHINGNCYHREAMSVAAKRRRAQERKMAKAFDKACAKNAVSLCASVVVGFIAIILGFVGFIHAAVAAIITGGALIFFGWALNDCAYLLGRCDK